MRSPRILGVVVATVLASAACSAPSSESQSAAAGRSAQTFAAALPANSSAACALLAPQTVQELEQTSGSCDRGIADAQLPRAGKVVDVQVYGLDAMVELEHDTMFLALFGTGWRVTAAGCKPQEQGRPYSCEIKGA